MDELLKMLYDAFYEPSTERTLEQTAEDCHRQLIERLEKPEFAAQSPQCAGRRF